MASCLQPIKRPADSSDEDSDRDNQRRRRKEYKFRKTRPAATNTPVGRSTIIIKREMNCTAEVEQLMRILRPYEHRAVTYEVSGRDDFSLTIENRNMYNVHAILHNLIRSRTFLRVVVSIPPPC